MVGQSACPVPGACSGLTPYFCRWVAQEASTSPDRAWTAGVEDYLTYVKGLLSEFSDVVEASDAKESAPKAPTFDAAPAFKLPAASAPALSFGGGAAPGLFSFGPPATAAAAPGEDEDEDAQDEEPTEVAMGGDDVEVLYKQRVTVLSMTPEKKWKGMGQGALTLRRPTTGGGRPFLAFTTDAGRVLLTAPLLQGVKPSFNANKPANLIMMLANSVGTDQPQSAMYIIRCADGDASKELRAAITEHV